MIGLVFGLHLYQPPNQDRGILKKIIRESYLPLIEAILFHNKAFFAVDIARSAIEKLEEINIGKESLEKFDEALELGKISLVNTIILSIIQGSMNTRTIAVITILGTKVKVIS